MALILITYLVIIRIELVLVLWMKFQICYTHVYRQYYSKVQRQWCYQFYYLLDCKSFVACSFRALYNCSVFGTVLSSYSLLYDNLYRNMSWPGIGSVLNSQHWALNQAPKIDNGTCIFFHCWFYDFGHVSFIYDGISYVVGHSTTYKCINVR